MTRDDTLSRRRLLRFTGAATAGAVLAGCADGGGGGNETEDGDTGDTGDGATGNGDTGDTGDGAVGDGDTGDGAAGDNETDDGVTGDDETEGNETGNETEGNETGNETEGNETGNETEGNETAGGGGGAIQPGEIQLEAYTENWIGVSPDGIADEENPTLTLTEGETYQVTWENGDGAGHNFAIWDDDQQVVEDYETEIMNQQGETQTLEFDVTSEMAQYVCIPHQTTMVGDIQLQ